MGQGRGEQPSWWGLTHRQQTNGVDGELVIFAVRHDRGPDEVFA